MVAEDGAVCVSPGDRPDWMFMFADGFVGLEECGWIGNMLIIWSPVG